MAEQRSNIERSSKDPMAGKYLTATNKWPNAKKVFIEGFEKAKERLAPLGGAVTPGVHDYEAFIYEVEGLRLVFYPHKTSAGNYHVRVRTSGKFDKALLRKAIFALAENTCTFQFPADYKLHQEAVMAALRSGRE